MTSAIFSAKKTRIHVEVDCYSGYKTDQRPVRFRLDGHGYLVEELLDQWYGQNESFFKVRADDGNLYILSRERPSPENHWRLVSFRKSA